MNRPNYIAPGYNAVMPALAFKNAAEAIEWYKEIFSAEERMIMKDQDGGIAHAELAIQDSVIMLSNEYPKYNKTPQTLGGNSINLSVYVPDVDSSLQKAVEKGAKLLMPAEDQFYGDRSGRIEDPFGYIWIISTHVRDVSEEEMKAKMEEMGAEEQS